LVNSDLHDSFNPRIAATASTLMLAKFYIYNLAISSLLIKLALLDILVLISGSIESGIFLV
jgi:hypothetical protein